MGALLSVIKYLIQLVPLIDKVIDMVKQVRTWIILKASRKERLEAISESEKSKDTSKLEGLFRGPNRLGNSQTLTDSANGDSNPTDVPPAK